MIKEKVLSFNRKKEDLIVCFSGGATSGFMSKWLKDNMSHIYNLIFIYANTGQEHEKTLEFVNKCDIEFNLNLIWLEAKVYHNERKACGYTIVDYESASRRGQPFEEVIKKYGLPNQNFLHCTRELKNNPIKAYQKENNLSHAKIALGIRSDEFRRVKLRNDAIYPLAQIINATKEEVNEWWKKQSFSLDLEEHYGNCITCYKKSDKKLKMIADENPRYFNFFIDMENKYGHINLKEGKEKRIIFRHFRTAFEVQNNLKLPDKMLNTDECAEECGSVILDEGE